MGEEGAEPRRSPGSPASLADCSEAVCAALRQLQEGYATAQAAVQQLQVRAAAGRCNDAVCALAADASRPRPPTEGAQPTVRGYQRTRSAVQRPTRVLAGGEGRAQGGRAQHGGASVLRAAGLAGARG